MSKMTAATRSGMPKEEIGTKMPMMAKKVPVKMKLSPAMALRIRAKANGMLGK